MPRAVLHVRRLRLTRMRRLWSLDLDEVEPIVAFLANRITADASRVRRGEVWIRSSLVPVPMAGCPDLKEAADILRGRRLRRDCASFRYSCDSKIYREAMEEGLLMDFMNAGCAIADSRVADRVSAEAWVTSWQQESVPWQQRTGTLPDVWAI